MGRKCSGRRPPLEVLPEDEDAAEVEDVPTTAKKPPFPTMDDCRKKIRPIPKDTSLFFTGLKTPEIKELRKWAETNGLTVVSMAYPDGYVNIKQYDGTDAQRYQFQKDFSQVFAEKSSGTAWLTIDDPAKVNEDGIFYSIEYKAMTDGDQVDIIKNFPFTKENRPPNPITSNSDTIKTYWERKKPDPPNPAGQGWCGVHVTHYQIPPGDNKYYLQANLKDANGVEIGHLDKTDATNPVNVLSALPYVLIITAAKPGSSDDPDGAPLNFAYAGTVWTSDDPAHCQFGGYEDGNREGDCGFAC